MRSISSTLEAAQEAGTGTPYIYLQFRRGAVTHNYSSDQAGRRILLIDHVEEPYDDFATIILRNNDRTIPNLKGYWTQIGYGFITEASHKEYSQTARLWVKHQQTVSLGGQLFDVLELEGMWIKLAENLILIGSPPWHSKTYTVDTVYDIMKAIYAEAGMTLLTLSEDDSIIGTYEPQFSINEYPFEDAATILYRLISMTLSYIRNKLNLFVDIVYPQGDDTVDINYYSDKAPWFYEYRQRDNLLIPNHIYVFANEGEDELWTDLIIAEAKNQTEIDKYFDIPTVAIAREITTQAEANLRATALLARGTADETAGRLIAPHDCRLELYDRIKIHDAR